MRKQKLKAFGVTCGIGSMLLGARNAGFQVLGNIEWRKYYHMKDADGRNTFLENFKGAKFISTDEYERDMPEEAFGVDIVLGHPECGCFSQLNPNKSAVHDATDIPLFVKTIALIKPRYFVMDDLPKSFIAFPMHKYVELLPEYDLFPEWISNYHYGNIQKQRKRMFMIGALKTEKFVFRPGEFKHDETVESTIQDLYNKEGTLPNHNVHDQSVACAKALHLNHHGHRATWKELAAYVNKAPPGTTIKYHSPDGRVLTRIGTYKGHWDGPGHVLTGGLSALHPKRGNPFSIRERARIQGFPDDFVFYGTVLERNGKWQHDKNMHMIRQTGKAMPVQFCEYVSRLIYAHINRDKKFKPTNERFLPPDNFVSQAKQWYCVEGPGYAAQHSACEACWLSATCPKSLVVPPAMREEMQREAERITKEQFTRRKEKHAPVNPRVKTVKPAPAPKLGPVYRDVEANTEKNW